MRQRSKAARLSSKTRNAARRRALRIRKAHAPKVRRARIVHLAVNAARGRIVPAVRAVRAPTARRVPINLRQPIVPRQPKAPALPLMPHRASAVVSAAVAAVVAEAVVARVAARRKASEIYDSGFGTGCVETANAGAATDAARGPR